MLTKAYVGTLLPNDVKQKQLIHQMSQECQLVLPPFSKCSHIFSRLKLCRDIDAAFPYEANQHLLNYFFSFLSPLFFWWMQLALLISFNWVDQAGFQVQKSSHRWSSCVEVLTCLVWMVYCLHLNHENLTLKCFSNSWKLCCIFSCSAYYSNCCIVKLCLTIYLWLF